MPCYALDGITPVVDPSAHVHPTAVLIGDVIVGCAMPEAEQGMNVARIGLLLAGLPASVPFCQSEKFSPFLASTTSR